MKETDFHTASKKGGADKGSNATATTNNGTAAADGKDSSKKVGDFLQPGSKPMSTVSLLTFKGGEIVVVDEAGLPGEGAERVQVALAEQGEVGGGVAGQEEE